MTNDRSQTKNGDGQTFGTETLITRRIGRVKRVTKDTSILAEINLDGVGTFDILTGVGFYDHMLAQFSKHGLFNLVLHADGDLNVDSHHVVEDAAITLGEAFRVALGTADGITRYGSASVPLDETLAHVSVDLLGRPYSVFESPNMVSMIGQYATSLTQHVFESFAFSSRISLHASVPHGRDAHHIVEAQYKALGMALREACTYDPRVRGVPSTKGVISTS